MLSFITNFVQKHNDYGFCCSEFPTFLVGYPEGLAGGRWNVTGAILQLCRRAGYQLCVFIFKIYLMFIEKQDLQREGDTEIALFAGSHSACTQWPGLSQLGVSSESAKQVQGPKPSVMAFPSRKQELDAK